MPIESWESRENERASQKYDEEYERESLLSKELIGSHLPSLSPLSWLVRIMARLEGIYTITKDLYSNCPVYEMEGTVWKVYFHKSNEWVVTFKPPSDNYCELLARNNSFIIIIIMNKNF